LHQDDVDRHAVQPGRESRFAAKGPIFETAKKCFWARSSAGRDWQPCANIANTRAFVQVETDSNAASWPLLACSIASASVIACFGAGYKSPFPAAYSFQIALNSLRLYLICRHVLDRSSSCQNNQKTVAKAIFRPSPPSNSGPRALCTHLLHICTKSQMPLLLRPLPALRLCRNCLQPVSHGVRSSAVCGGARRKACAKKPMMGKIHISGGSLRGYSGADCLFFPASLPPMDADPT